MKKDCNELDLNQGSTDLQTDAPEGTAMGDSFS